MRLIFRSLILLISVMAYGQADEAVTGQTDKPAAEQVDKVATGDADKTAIDQKDKTVSGEVAKTATEQPNKVAADQVIKATPGPTDKTVIEQKDKTASGEIAKPASEQADKSAPKQADKPVPGEAAKTASEQPDKTTPKEANKAAPKQANKAASGKTAKVKLVTKPLPEMGMGNPKAPITIINYSSLTCGHCAQFHTAVLPKIEEKYIKPGLVRIIFRDYPGDQVSINAHRLAWCKGEMKYLDFVKLLYSTQEKWLSASDPLAALKSIALQNGITAKQFEASLKDQELLDKIIQLRLEGQKKYNITATPTIIINAKIYPRALSFDEFEDIIKPLLAPTLEKDEQKAKGSEEKIKKKDVEKVSEEKEEKKEKKDNS
jgi:protein-disulfide isomerase